MIEVKVLNSPIPSNKKFRYLSMGIFFQKALTAGAYVVSDSEQIRLRDAPLIYLLKACGSVDTYEDVSGKTVTTAVPVWTMQGLSGTIYGDMMKPTILVAGSGNIAYNSNIIQVRTNQQLDLSQPDGSGFPLFQGDGILLKVEGRTSTAFGATAATMYASLLITIAISQSTDQSF